MTARGWGTIILCVELLAGCKGKSTPGAPEGTSNAVPSQILEHFETRDIRNGELAMVLEAERGRIFEETEVSELDAPIVQFYKGGQPSSRMIAPQGKVHLKTHAIEAWGGVNVVTSDSATLTTDRLRYDPKIRKILSDDPVRLERPDAVTEGIGLESDPELTQVKILRQRAVLRQGAQPQ